MVLKFYTFSAIMHSSRIGLLMVRQVATLPMSCYIVREMTTLSVPQRYTGSLRTSQPLVALYFDGSTDILIYTSSGLWYLPLGTTKLVLICATKAVMHRPYI